MNAKRKKKSSSKKTKESHYKVTDQRRSVHVKIPEAVREGFRKRSELKDVWQTELWDEAAQKFLAKARTPGSVFYAHPAKGVGYTVVWIERRLMDQLKQLAKRDEVSMARVIHTALAHYVADVPK
jgi:hypothetical protein